MTNKIYCPSMWKSVHIDTDGYLTPCCLFIKREDKKTRISDIKENISEVLHGEFSEYREQMIRGEWPRGCNQCKFAEEEGRSSKRDQDMWMVKSKLMKSEPEKVDLEYLQLKTGRLCNLKCTICTPACSTTIATEWLKIGKLSREHYDIYQNDIEWSYDIKEYDKMTPPENYFRIDIAGGEPLMNKTHFKWLNKLTNTKDTQLLYNTNGTFRPTRDEINIWKKFRGIWLSFSIDSYGKKFEELRVGAKWDEVLSNLKHFQEEVIKHEFDNNSNCSVVVTVSKYNVMDVFDLYRILTDEVDFNHPEPINFNYLYYPEALSCHNMEKQEIEKIVKHYDLNLPTLDINSKMYKQCKDLRDSLITFLDDK